MEQVKILIVEDEVIIAEDLNNKLQEIGYEVCGMAYSYQEATEQLKKATPNLVLIDVQLSELKDGIDLAELIRKEYNLPFLFVTSNADSHTIERAKSTQPSGYVVKPFQKRALYAAIEIALNKQLKPTVNSNPQSSNSPLFIKESHQYTQVKKQEIQWLKAEGNYTHIQTENGKHLVRGKLREILDQLSPNFIRIHKSYAVNINSISVVQHSCVSVGDKQIPVGDMYRKTLLEKITFL